MRKAILRQIASLQPSKNQKRLRYSVSLSTSWFAKVKLRCTGDPSKIADRLHKVLAVYSYFVSVTSVGVDFGISVGFLGSEFMTRRITPRYVFVFISLLAIGALLISTRPTSMFKVCLFSPVKGKVIFKGQPVAGAVIERSYDWAWGNKKATDQTTTDQNGEFSLPAIYNTMILGQVAPHEPVIDQTINILHEGKTHEAWYFHKGEYSENGELNGRDLSFLCDLGDQPQKKGDGRFRFFGIAGLK